LDRNGVDLDPKYDQHVYKKNASRDGNSVVYFVNISLKQNYHNCIRLENRESKNTL